MVASRENVTGFLNTTDIINLQQQGIDVNNLSFYQAAKKIFDLYENKTINNKTATAAIKLMCSKNTFVKTERYRLNNDGVILEYSEQHKAYLFLKKGGQRELNKLITRNGEYI